MGLFSILKNMLNSKPVYMGQYLFTKGDRRITFQEMIHVAGEDLYKNINNDIKEFLNTYENGKIYLEGIHGDNKYLHLNNKKMMGIFGIKEPVDNTVLFLKKYYYNLAYITGLEVQQENNYLNNIANDKRVKADITHEELWGLIKDLPESKKKTDILLENKKEIEKAKGSKLLCWITKKVLRSAALSRNSWGSFKKTEALQLFHKVILNERNKVLLDMLNTSSDKDIFVTYGAAHFEEIKENLISQGYHCKLIKNLDIGF